MGPPEEYSGDVLSEILVGDFAQLKKLVADLSLDNQILKEVASGES